MRDSVCGGGVKDVGMWLEGNMGERRKDRHGREEVVATCNERWRGRMAGVWS